MSIRSRLFAVREYVRSSLWVVPAVALLLSFVLAEAAARVDRRLGDEVDFGFSGGSDAARAVLTTISTSMITFTGVVFSVTMLVLQLASQQLSPRVLRTFLRDWGTQVVLGVFTASFTYSLLVLRRVGSTLPGEATVPGISVWLALVLVLASVVLFIYFIHHIAQSIRPGNVIRRVLEETRSAIDEVYPERNGEGPRVDAAEPESPAYVVRMGARGRILLAIDKTGLSEFARERRILIRVVPRVGAFVPPGSEAIYIWGPVDGEAAGRALEHLGFGNERSITQDPAFGFRQLVDIAERALSPGTNDPTTAVQVLDALHNLLAVLMQRPMPEVVALDEGGHTSVILHQATWDDFVGLALDEIRHYGQSSVQVLRRQQFLLADLLSRAPDDRKEALTRRRELLNAATDLGFELPADRFLARRPGSQGSG